MCSHLCFPQTGSFRLNIHMGVILACLAVALGLGWAAIHLGLAAPHRPDSAAVFSPAVLSGDLTILFGSPVQVVDGKINLVKGKAATFRLSVRSTFSTQTQVMFSLSLPPAYWSTAPVCGNVSTPISVPSRLAFPQHWGPVTIPPGDSEVLIPNVSLGNEARSWSDGGAGIYRCACSGFRCALNTRVMPRPTQSGAYATIQIDSLNQVAETDESNNAWNGAYGVVPVRRWSFFFVPYNTSAGTAARTGFLSPRRPKNSSIMCWALFRLPMARSVISSRARRSVGKCAQASRAMRAAAHS